MKRQYREHVSPTAS